MRITLDTKPSELAALYQRLTSSCGVTLDPDADAATLKALARRHAGFEHNSLVLEKIVAHRHCTVDLLELALELDPEQDSSSIENTVVTSGKAPRALLERLAGSRHRSVREHVEYALLLDDLRHADEAEYLALYHRYREHPTLGYGLRGYIAGYSPNAPKSVLEDIVVQGGTSMSEQAQARLRDGKHG